MELMLDPSSIADYRAAKGMSLEWIQENSRKAMLYREYWLLASGDVYV